MKSLKELRRPARGAVDALHDESLKYLMRIAVARVGKHNWRAAAEETADLYETVKSWTTPSHQATIAHVLAACLEAQGQMKKAAEYCEQFQRLEG